MKTDTIGIFNGDRRNEGIISVESKFVYLGSGFFLDPDTSRIVAL